MKLTKWRPENTIIKGEFCTPAEIQSQLAFLAEAIDAQVLVLVAHDDQTVLRSLTLCSGPSTVAKEIAQHFDSTTFTRSSFELALTSSDDVAQEVDTIISDLSRFRFFEPLAAVHEVSPWKAFSLGSRNRDRPRIRGLLLVDYGSSSAISCPRKSDLRRLHAMLVSTANASVYRDTALTKKIGELAKPLPFDLGLPVNDSAMLNLLEILRDEIDVDSVAWYQANPTSTHLDLLMDVDSAVLNPKQSVVITDMSSLVAVALDRKQPVMLAASHSRFQVQSRDMLLRSTWSSGGREVDELAVPIPGAPLGNFTPSPGVLSVARLRTDSSDFGHYDLAVVRNAAIRLAYYRELSRSHQTMDRLADSMSAHLHTIGPLAQGTRDTSRVQPGIPHEFGALYPELQSLLIDAASGTDSRTASLRVLVPSDIRGVDFELVRFVAEPVGILRDENSSIPVDFDSINGWVAQTGQPCKVSDTESANAVDPFPRLRKIREVRDSRSELCVPIRADGKLVATLNFESGLPHAYELLVPVAKAYASEVGLLLSRFRADTADRVLSIASQLHRDSHEILQELDEVQEDYESFINAEDSTRNSQLLELRRLLQGSSRREDIVYQGSADLESMITASMMKIGGLPHALHIVGGEESPIVHPNFEATISSALTDILANVQTHMSRNQDDLVQVSISRCLLGGVQYSKVSIEHAAADLLPQTLADRLFRVPVYRSGQRERPHLGCYTAGSLLRTIGGDAYFRLRGARNVSIVALIPVI